MLIHPSTNTDPFSFEQASAISETMKRLSCRSRSSSYPRFRPYSPDCATPSPCRARQGASRTRMTAREHALLPAHCQSRSGRRADTASDLAPSARASGVEAYLAKRSCTGRLATKSETTKTADGNSSSDDTTPTQ